MARKTPPHPRSYGAAQKGRGAQLIRKAWRKWGKRDARAQAQEV
jgi:hypothetical protein